MFPAVLINFARAWSLLSSTDASPCLGGVACPLAAAFATLTVQPISLQRVCMKREGVSPSNMTRCFELPCRTRTGASGL